ncbi:MerC domain-containing protein [Sphingomicrobium sp. XHP0239]|uniref:MerC domain-containing protein n=1 Tax=Sphingomicrobium maritimum TaxID=3133972 RepID=UPI0031CCD1C4
MTTLLRNSSFLDRLGIGLSTLCAVHCVVTTVLVAILASAGGIFGSDLLHEVGLGFAVIIGAFAIGRGISEHGYMMPGAVGGMGLGVMMGALSLPHGGSEILATLLGVGLLALGHRLNSIARD